MFAIHLCWPCADKPSFTLIYHAYTQNPVNMLKRKAAETAGNHPKKETKKLRTRKADILTEAKPLEKRVEPYYLGAARFRINILNPTWAYGTNRVLSKKQTSGLVKAFSSSTGICRTEREHRLRVLCKSSDVQKMQEWVKSSADTQSGNSGAEDATGKEAHVGVSNAQPGTHSGWDVFDNWQSVVGNSIELIAGQHRVEALKEILRKRNQSGDEEGWWVCDIYDAGLFTLPLSHGTRWPSIMLMHE